MRRVGTIHRNGTPAQHSTDSQSDESDYAGVILAGGDGIRLSSFTRKIFGYHVPKQFCPLFEGETLLELTMRRVSLVVPPERTITVLNRAHERFYSPILGASASPTLLIEPENRGTGAAVLCALLRTVAQGHAGPVAIFASDHYVSDDSLFVRHVSAAFRAVELAPRLAVLLGISPEGPETEYGWIEPGVPVARTHPALGQINQIRRFWEKPSSDVAQELYSRGCLWNTSILIGNAMTLLSLTAGALPEMYHEFTRHGSFPDSASEEEKLGPIFRHIPSVDFSKSVLAEFPEQFSVLPVTGITWSDLGDARRLLAAISRNGAHISGGNHNVFKGRSFTAPGPQQQIRRYKASLDRR